MHPKEECIVFNPGGFKLCGLHARNSFISNDCDYEKTEYLVINTPDNLLVAGENIENHYLQKKYKKRKPVRPKLTLF